MPIAPDIRDELKRVALALDAAPHGGRRALAQCEAAQLGMSIATLYRQLERQVGWDSGRKVRADKGSTRQAMEGIEFVAGAQKATVRKNGKEILPTGVAMSIADATGVPISVGASQMNRLVRARHMDVTTQKQGAPAVGMRSLHPNHLHQVDPSLCLVYYDRGQQVVIRDDEHYKNKLSKLAELKNKVWRYVLTDHTSGTIIPYYISAKGETQKNLFEFLLFAWSQRANRPFHGVPKMLMMDPGSANTAHSIRNFCRALQVELVVNKPHNARAKGSVENAQNIVETHFESLLRFRPAKSVEEMNELAFAWANGYNANAIKHVDCRLHREGMVPQSRYDLWLRIRQDELRLLPPREVCTNLLLGVKAERKVTAKLEVTYRHPQLGQSVAYDLSGLAGVVAGDVVEVWPMWYGRGLVTVRVQRYDGEALEYRLEPIGDYNEFGHRESWAVFGQGYKAHAETDAVKAGKQLDRAVYGERPLEEIERMKEKSAQPFAHINGGRGADSLDHLKDLQMPTWMPRRGEEIQLPVAKTEAPVQMQMRRDLHAEGHSLDVPSRVNVSEEKPLGHVDAAMLLQARMADAWQPEMFARLAELYPDGVAEDELQVAADRLMGNEVEAPARGHLRAVK